MPLDTQITQMLESMQDMPVPDFSSLSASEYRAYADNLMPPMPGEPMHEVRELAVPGAAGLLSARLYRPSAETDLPLLVFFHGGGFVIGTLETHDNLCRTLAKRVGAVVVSVAYRLAPEAPFPAAPLDCYQATCWLAEHAAEIGADASRLALAGDSAGANLAVAVSRLSAERGGPAVAYQCLFYPVADARCSSDSYRQFGDGYFLSAEMMGWFWRQYLVGADATQDPLASPLLACDLAQQPATTVVTAEFDVLRDEGEAFAERLRAEGVDVCQRRYEGMIHGFVSLLWVDVAQRALAEAAMDLRAALGLSSLPSHS